MSRNRFVDIKKFDFFFWIIIYCIINSFKQLWQQSGSEYAIYKLSYDIKQSDNIWYNFQYFSIQYTDMGIIVLNLIIGHLQ